ncbi:hypothetical protein [Aeoliella mucimassa]|uniref:Uncharacterized protein n=1 Tax=Aeoliella mucimassa TaxID=2527972 RepID=A0A518AHP9_9BACT|nr:hypothetical protein [Aeoliella mucimassa]QDU54204.1 hypothetical protein Pan181_03840 [Aeoliella mucimassa]
MNPRNLWKPEQVFIEIGAENADTADALRANGFDRYLGICNTPLRAESLDAARSDLENYFTYTDDNQVVRRNNAEVLMLSGPATLQVWYYRNVRHVDQVAWRAEISLWTLFGLLGWLWHLVTGRYSMARMATLRRPGALTQRFFVAHIRHRKARGPSGLHYIPQRLGIRGMFAELNGRDLDYVVLRGWERLPRIDSEIGLAILASDDAWGTLVDLLDAAPGIKPCQVHGEQQDDACLPEHLADQAMRGAIRHRDLCLVPNKRDYFHSLAYHAVYVLGTKSRLPIEGSRKLKNSATASDYNSRLRRLADEMGIGVEISLSGLHHYLMRNGWHPPIDTLAPLAESRRHRWLEPLVQDAVAAEEAMPPMRRAA